MLAQLKHKILATALVAACAAFAWVGGAAAQSGEPIKIGYSMSLTGGLAPNGRAALLAHLDTLGTASGVVLDTEANQMDAPIVSPPGTACVVRVVETNEDLMVARHTRDVLQGRAAGTDDRRQQCKSA